MTVTSLLDNAVKKTTDKCCYRIGWAISQTSIEHFLVVRIFYTGCHIHPVSCPVSMSQHGGMYCKERIS